MSYRSKYATDFDRGWDRGQAAKRANFQRVMRDKMVIASRGATRGMTFVSRTRGPRSVTERKYFDSFKSNMTVPAATDWTATEADPATLNCLFAPQEGSDLDNRIGRKVNVHKITIRGVLTLNSQANQVAGDIIPQVRLILYQDQQTNATQAQGEDLMGQPGAVTSVLATCTFQNTANFGRFKVLRDVPIELPMPTISWDGTNLEQMGKSVPFKLNYKFKKPVHVRFNATSGGSVGDIVDNSFHLLANSNSGITTDLLLSYQVRTVYTDN